MKESIHFVRSSTQNWMDKFEKYQSSSMRLEMLKIVQGILQITNYLERSPYVPDYVIREFGCFVNKIFKYVEEDLIDYQGKLDDQTFSIAEWNTASEERKLSIISFILAAIKPNQIEADDYESTIKQFDKETLEWLKNNTPYEEVRESLAYHYCKNDKNE